MSAAQLDLFSAPKVASVRRSDPRTAKTAAAQDPEGRSHQRTLILRHLVQHGRSNADDLGRLIGRHRSTASTRLNVLAKAGMAEKCGEMDAADEYGRVRSVEAWRATDAGRAALDRSGA